MPMSASTFSSIGYVYALKGDLIEAVEAFHKALGIRRDDTFSTTMLNRVMEHMLHDDAPFSGRDRTLLLFLFLEFCGEILEKKEGIFKLLAF